MTTQQQRVIGLVLLAVGSYLLVILMNKVLGTTNTTMIKSIGYWIMFQVPGAVWLLVLHDKQQNIN